MTHIKNMLKYLLIMIMALSLLAVSCTKDKNNPTNPNPPVTDGGEQGGSGSGGTPTNPTIDAATLNAAIIQSAGGEFKYNITDYGVDLRIDFSSFKPANGNANLKADIDWKINLNNLKTELEKALSFSSGGVTATATIEKMPGDYTDDPVTVIVEIDAGNNTFADDVKTAYTVKDKKATVKIVIKPEPDKRWVW